MEFGISKCGVLVMKKGKVVHSESIEFPSGERIKETDRDKAYKYLGKFVKKNDIKDIEMVETLLSM